MATAFDLTSTNSSAWVANPYRGMDRAQDRGFFVLLSGTGTCKVEYTLDGTNVAAPDGVTLAGPASFGPIRVPADVTHIRVTNVSGNSVGSICR